MRQLSGLPSTGEAGEEKPKCICFLQRKLLPVFGNLVKRIMDTSGWGNGIPSLVHCWQQVGRFFLRDSPHT